MKPDTFTAFSTNSAFSVLVRLALLLLPLRAPILSF
jgi:hypothetical protein